MFVYMKTAEPQARHTLMVTPDIPEFHQDGCLLVEFTHGRAEVPDNLGRWLVDQGYVRETRQLLHLPVVAQGGFAA